MPRPAKCRICGAKLSTDTAYKTTINNKPAYFCNESHYKQFIEKIEEGLKAKERGKKLHNKVCALFAEILGVKSITNTILYKEKAEINKAFSDETIIAYLEDNKEWIMKVASRLNGSEYGKIKYISTILKNKLGDYQPRVNTKTPTCNYYCADEHYETKFKLKPRKALLDFEEEYDEQ